MAQNGSESVRIIRASAPDARVPFQDGFLAGDLARIAGLRLAGSRCGECGIALWGVRRRCENCSSTRLSVQAFAPTGSVHTFTVQRYAPPQPHALPEPWAARPLAWVDLDEGGPRVLTPVLCAPEAIAIGLRVRLRCDIGHIDEQGREVVTYGFAPENAA